MPRAPGAPGALPVRQGIAWGHWLLAGAVFAFLGAFLLLPVSEVIYTAFVTETGALTLSHFSNFFGQTLLRESLLNSLTVALASMFFALVIAVLLSLLMFSF